MLICISDFVERPSLDIANIKNSLLFLHLGGVTFGSPIKKSEGGKLMRTRKRWFGLLIAVIVVIALVCPLNAEEPSSVNINTASADELVKLEKIGPQYAARIVEYREKNGPFKAPEDIMNVAGIGPKTYEMNKDRIVISDN
jgi:competence protein ComEA